VSGPRETLFAAITAQLEEIKIVNDYALDVDKVYRLDVVPDEMPSQVRRALCVLESLTPERPQYLDSGASGGYLCDIKVTIAGIVRHQTADLKSSDRHTELNAFIDATRKALMEDRTFGGACKNSEIVSGPVGMVDMDKGEALFNIDLRCFYAFGFGDL